MQYFFPSLVQSCALYVYLLTIFISLDTDVDAIDVCLNGRFLVVCEKNGNLHLIYVPQKKILLTRVHVFACVFCIRVAAVIAQLAGFCHLLLFICMYICVYFGLCRLWCRNHPVRIRKLTTISLQRRANHLQVKSFRMSRHSVLKKNSLLSFQMFIFFKKHIFFYRNAPCVPCGERRFFLHYKSCTGKDWGGYDPESVLCGKFTYCFLFINYSPVWCSFSSGETGCGQFEGGKPTMSKWSW